MWQANLSIIKDPESEELLERALEVLGLKNSFRIEFFSLSVAVALDPDEFIIESHVDLSIRAFYNHCINSDPEGGRERFRTSMNGLIEASSDFTTVFAEIEQLIGEVKTDKEETEFIEVVKASIASYILKALEEEKPGLLIEQAGEIRDKLREVKQFYDDNPGFEASCLLRIFNFPEGLLFQPIIPHPKFLNSQRIKQWARSIAGTLTGSDDPGLVTKIEGKLQEFAKDPLLEVGAGLYATPIEISAAILECAKLGSYKSVTDFLIQEFRFDLQGLLEFLKNVESKGWFQDTSDEPSYTLDELRELIPPDPVAQRAAKARAKEAANAAAKVERDARRAAQEAAKAEAKSARDAARAKRAVAKAKVNAAARQAADLENATQQVDQAIQTAESAIATMEERLGAASDRKEELGPKVQEARDMVGLAIDVLREHESSLEGDREKIAEMDELVKQSGQENAFKYLPPGAQEKLDEFREAVEEIANAPNLSPDDVANDAVEPAADTTIFEESDIINSAISAASRHGLGDKKSELEGLNARAFDLASKIAEAEAANDNLVAREAALKTQGQHLERLDFTYLGTRTEVGGWITTLRAIPS